MHKTNFFNIRDLHLKDEYFEDIYKNSNVRIERIVSTGHRSEPGFWYDQNWDEWVILMKGQAILRFKDEKDTVTLNPGDHLLIKKNVKHRVEYTTANPATIWLAVHVEY